MEELIVEDADGNVNLSSNIESLERQIEVCRLEIEAFLGRKDPVDVSELAQDFESTDAKALSIEEEITKYIDYLKNHLIYDINNMKCELRNLMSEIGDVDFALSLCDRLIECNKLLEDYRASKLKDDLTGSVSSLSAITDLINNGETDLSNLRLFNKIKNEQVILWDELLDGLSEMWSRFINWSETTVDNKKCVYLNIHHGDNDRRKRLLTALVSSNQIRIEMKKLSNFLLNQILIPIIHQDAFIEHINDDYNRLKIIFTPRKKNQLLKYETVLDNLKIVFEFLSSNLDDSSLMRSISDFICDNFTDTLIKDCLVHTIPNCISELQDYGRVTSEVEKFQLYLTSVQFFQSDDFSILNYANNIDVLFANKTSQYFLENARVIQKKDLGSTMSVGSETPVDEKILNLDVGADEREVVDCFFKTFATSPFRFPRCAVSKSVHELLDLVVLMMEQAVEASDLCACRLYYTARNVFELYIAIVPLHHKHLLDTMPQQVALFHNNCMYLAHHLLTLGPKWQKNMAGRELTYNIIFCDLVKELRDLATNTLLAHLRFQRKQILDTIRESDLYYIAIKDTLSNNAEQAVRQCIRQLQVLKTIWIGIFPADVYKRLITCLANIFVEELISKVIVQEDITAEVAMQLSELYKLVLNRLPQIYDDVDAIEDGVRSWPKLKELILVLNGSLAIIEERWSNGSGPLAAQFTAEEIKRLIRALFQNTAFRANLLGKIK